MKKAIIPLFLFMCLALTGIMLYGGVLWHYHKGAEYTEDMAYAPLTLETVKAKSNVSIQPNVEYMMAYKVRDYHYADGVLIKSDRDTMGSMLLAVGPKGVPKLPPHLVWRK